MYNVQVYIDHQRLDLFENEPIWVKSSVQNIDDISRVFNDFSQGFNVPASPTNNKIFEHFYNYHITGGFDARIRHPGYIWINGIPFRKGSIRLDGATVQGKSPKQYSITFLGQLIDLKEVIGDDYLSDLDLSDYDITYNSDNVKTGITTGYSSADLVFPLISTERQWFYNSDVTST